jgi:hypothetical protein
MAAPWVILGRVPRIAAVAGAEPGDDAEADPADFSLAVPLVFIAGSHGVKLSKPT